MGSKSLVYRSLLKTDTKMEEKRVTEQLKIVINRSTADVVCTGNCPQMELIRDFQFDACNCTSTAADSGATSCTAATAKDPAEQ